jgi:anti-sigma regulatory factor (Ser/Thr protein kinase)
MKKRGSSGDLRGMADAFLGRVDPQGRRFASRAATAWAGVVGPEIARHTMGSALRDGELLVFVDTATWANELSVMSEHLRERLNQELGEDLVRSVRFAVSREVRRNAIEHAGPETPDTTGEGKVELVPLDEQERAQVEYAASSIHDEGLREAAVRAMTRHIERRKGTRARNGRDRPSE